MNTNLSSDNNSTLKLINLLDQHRTALIAQWVSQVKAEFGEEVSLTEPEFADHMVYIIDALVDELRKYQQHNRRNNSLFNNNMNYQHGYIADTKNGGQKHGQQRAGTHAYNADKIYWEYTILRAVLVEFLQNNQLLNVNHLEIVTCVIERCTRESMSVFTEMLHATQRKLLGAIVHDIRSPLYVISMLGELASEQHDIAKTPEFGQRINSATGRISVMLEDILQTLSVESGQGIEINFKEANFTDFLSSVAQEAVNFYGSGLKLRMPDWKVVYTFDEIILRRVLENLFSNAFKYGKKDGDVTVRMFPEDDQIVLEVHNYGDPIEEHRWKDIFKYFKSSDSRSEKVTKSWGIGLAFVKCAVEGHGGEVTVSSSAQHGTIFTITLPKNVNVSGKSTLVKID